MTLYHSVENAIEQYYKHLDAWDYDDWLDAIEQGAKAVYPNNKILVYAYDTDNDTWELDRQLDEVMAAMRTNTVVDYCNLWDEETIVSVMVVKK